jgi:hypothetical protein
MTWVWTGITTGISATRMGSGEGRCAWGGRGEEGEEEEGVGAGRAEKEVVAIWRAADAAAWMSTLTVAEGVTASQMQDNESFVGASLEDTG